jgi:cytochrome c-type biogenesis protein
MDSSLLAFALAAGLVAALNPCGFAMLPAYLALVVLGNDSTESARGRGGVVGRALLATALMALGFLVVFGTFGVVIAPFASSLQRYLPAVTVVIGVVMVVLGVWLLTGRELTGLLPRSGRGAPTGRLGSMFGYGVAYAIASLSCTIGPFLAVTTSSFATGSFPGAVGGFVAYGLGMALVVGVLAVTVALAGYGAATRARRLLPYVNRVAGALLVLVGLYVGYYGVYELRLFFGGGSARDPVVGAAGAIQQTLSGWVDAIGALPLVAALIVLVVGAALVHRRRHTSRQKVEAHTATERPPGP